ncbi:MAG TPA: hypothetical protein VHB50_02830, partial [Bryobacteraceae bacterium]|nr:hypothetical protein [Bryobacteraceae bacterium]
GTPVSLADAMQTRQPDHVLENRQGGIPSVGSMGGVISGSSTDREAKDEYLLHFFRNIDRAVNECLKNNAPLIPVGVEHELALYRRVNTYQALIEQGVHGAPDGLEGGELQSRAMALLAERSRHFGNAVPADFDKRVGLGRASIRIPEIVSAAWEGRVSQLFFQEDAHYTGAFDPVRRRVKHTDDPLDSPVDLIESAAYQTVLHGGEARILPASAMPNGVAACAVFRYAPVAEKPGEMVGTAV